MKYHNPNKRKKKINNKIIIKCIFFACALSISIFSIGFYIYYNFAINSYKNYIKAEIQIADTYIDKKDMEKCIQTGKKTKIYENTQILFNKLKDATLLDQTMTITDKSVLESLNLTEPIKESEAIYLMKIPKTNNEKKITYVMCARDANESELGMKEISLGDEDFTNWYSAKLVSELFDFSNNNSEEIKYFVDNTPWGYMLLGSKIIKTVDNKALALLCVSLPIDIIYKILLKYILIVVIGTVLLSILFLYFFTKNLNKTLVQPIKDLESSTEGLTAQFRMQAEVNELEFKKVPLDTKDEIASLSESLSEMTEELKNYIKNMLKKSKKKNEEALRFAAKVQRDSLPSISLFSEIDNFDMCFYNNPAKIVSGDFYDAFLLDDDHLCFIIADVVDKDVPAGMYMMKAKAVLKEQIKIGHSSNKKLCESIFEVNNILYEQNDLCMFVTAFIGVLNFKTGVLTYVDAGHEPTILKRKNEECKILDAKINKFLGLSYGNKYENNEIQLNVGDWIYLYTDGVTDAENEYKEMYKDDRLMETLNHPSLLRLNSEDKIKFVKKSIAKFIGEAHQFDDITMMVLEVKKIG